MHTRAVQTDMMKWPARAMLWENGYRMHSILGSPDDTKLPHSVSMSVRHLDESPCLAIIAATLHGDERISVG